MGIPSVNFNTSIYHYERLCGSEEKSYVIDYLLDGSIKTLQVILSGDGSGVLDLIPTVKDIACDAIVKKVKSEIISIVDKKYKFYKKVASRYDIERELPRMLAEDIDDYLNKHPNKKDGVVIFLDAFDIFDADFYSSVEHRFFSVNFGMISNSPQVLFVILGQNKLNIKGYPIVSHEVSEFSECQAKDYLAIHKIPDKNNLHEKIYEKTKGLPYYLNLLIREYEIKPVIENIEELLERGLEESLLEYHLKHFDAKHLDVFSVLSLLPKWNLEMIYSVLNKKDLMLTYNLSMLKEYSIIRDLENSYFIMHDLMRACFLKRINKGTFAQLKDTASKIIRRYIESDILPNDINAWIKYSYEDTVFFTEYIILRINDLGENNNFLDLLSELKSIHSYLSKSGRISILFDPFVRGKDILAEKYTKQSEQYLEWVNELSFIYSDAFESANALEASQEVYNIRNELAPNDLKTLRAGKSLAFDLCKNQQYGKAHTIMEDVYLRCIEHFPQEVNLLWEIKSNLAYYSYMLGMQRIENGVNLSKEVFEYRLTGDNMQKLLKAWENYAVQLMGSHQVKKAIDEQRKVCRQLDDIYGFQNRDTLQAYQYLGNFLVRDSRYEDAAKYLEKVYATRISMDELNSINLIDCECYLSLAYIGLYQTTGDRGYMDKAKERVDSYYQKAQREIVNNPIKLEMYNFLTETINNERFTYIEDLLYIISTYQQKAQQIV